jgi:hypothetical protein
MSPGIHYSKHESLGLVRHDVSDLQLRLFARILTGMQKNVTSICSSEVYIVLL